MEFSRQEYWSGLPFPSPKELPDLGIKPRCPVLKTDSLGFQRLPTFHSLWPHFSSNLSTPHTVISLAPFCLCLSFFKSPCDDIGPTQIIRIISPSQGQLINNHLLLPCDLTQPQFQGVGRGHHWGWSHCSACHRSKFSFPLMIFREHRSEYKTHFFEFQIKFTASLAQSHPWPCI